MSTYIVRERSDGRGGIHPFGSYRASQKGATVRIGDRDIKVTSDGRVNIPAKIMKEYGIVGDDGRRRLAIRFAAEPGRYGWKKLGAQVANPGEQYKNAGNEDIVKVRTTRKDRLDPKDSPDYNWSP